MKVKGLLKSIFFFVLYVLLLLVFQTLSSVALMAIEASKGIRDEKLIIEFANNNLLISNGISLLSVSLIFVLIFKLRKANIKNEFKLHKCSLKQLFISLLLAFSYSILFLLLSYEKNFENGKAIHDSVSYFSRFSPGLGLILMIINLIILAPLSEEIAFRGVIYTRSETGSSSIVSIIVSSLLFGIMHMSAGGVLLVSGAFIMGFILSFIYYKTGSLYACILSHSIANFPDFIFYDHPTLSGIWNFSIICISAVAMVVSFILLYRSEKTNKQ